MGEREDAQAPVPLELSCRVGPGGEVVVDLGGELDIVSAEAAVRNPALRPITTPI